MRFLNMAALLAGITLAGSSVAQATELSASIWFPESHPLTSDGYVKWAEQLREQSGGDLTLNLFTGTALLPAAAHLTGLRDGIADITYHAGTYTPSDLPEDNVLAILGIALKDNVVVAAAVSDFYLNDPGMKAMFDRHGIVFLGGYATPPYILMCNQKVETLADIQGKKIRMPGAVHAVWAEKVGAVPISVPSTEMFTGLERGQLDCAANAANDMKSRSLWDVAKHVTTLDLGSYFSGWLQAINADSWAGLTDAQRKMLLDTVSGAVVDAAIAYNVVSDEALAEASDHGVTIYEPADDLKQALSEFNENEMRDFALQQGSEQFNLEGSEELIERFEQTIEKWRGLYADVDRQDAATIKQILYDNLYSKVDPATYGLAQ